MKTTIRKTGLLAGLFFTLFPISASATTFGPIPVVLQAQNSQYFVRGRVVGSSWTKMAPRLNRPYTYWRVLVSEQPIGESLGGEIVVREPGGEIGDMGYHMAGTAEFAAGEDVYIGLHDADDQSEGSLPVREVVGLASGKYRVETGKDGKQILMNGLGIPIAGAGGRLLTPADFSALLQRISRNQATEDDKNIFVSRKPVHENEHDDGLQAEARERDVRALLNMNRTTSATSPREERHPADMSSVTNTAAAIQENQVKAEEPSTGSSVGSWAFAVIIVLGLLVGLVMILRR